jgi:hypothetical protein
MPRKKPGTSARRKRSHAADRRGEATPARRSRATSRPAAEGAAKRGQTAAQRATGRGEPRGKRNAAPPRARSSSARRSRTQPALPAVGRGERADRGAQESATSVAAEALRSGVLPRGTSRRDEQLPGDEANAIRVGDPDVSPLGNEYSGEETPGSSTPTPDQSVVDEIGRAYGVEEGATGALRSSSELLDRRDRRRRD